MPIEVVDNATPFLQKIGREAPQYIDKSLKSAGWWLRGKIREGIKSGAPGGQPYRPFSGIANERGKSRTITLDRLSQKTGQRKRIRQRVTRNILYREKNHKPLGRLAQAVKYKFYPDSHRVAIGWITRSAERIGEKQEKGASNPVTRRVRAMFAFADIPLSASKTSIAIPARPTIGPEYRENAPKIPGYLEQKIFGYIERADVGW